MLTMLPKEITVLFPFYDTDNQHYNIRAISEYWKFVSLQSNWTFVTVLATAGLNEFPKPEFDINVMQALKILRLCLYFSG